MKEITRRRPRFTFASTLLRVEIKNSLYKEVLARVDSEKYKPVYFQESSVIDGNIGFHMENEILSHF